MSTTTAELCPTCLIELPAGYPFDHAAIDQALNCHPDWARARFRALTLDDRGELVRIALARGAKLNALYRRFGVSPAWLRRLASRPSATADKQVAA